MTALALVCLSLAAVPAMLIGWNLLLVRTPRAPGVPVRNVSVLIPARNEAHNIRAALTAVLASRGVELEVLVLDDDSSDSTSERVAEIARGDSRVRLLERDGLPPGLCGKPHACQQLASEAAGESLVFIDADVRVEPEAIAAVVSVLERTGSAMVSGIPHQETRTPAERLVIPLMDFVLYGFLPVRLMRMSRHPAFGAACGQLVAVRRDAYDAIGGHAAIATQVHDGLALARRFRQFGHPTDLIDASRLARCRMYTSWRELRDGFAKNAHEGLGSPAGIVPWTLLLGLGQIAPFVLLPVLWASAEARLWLAIAALLGLAARGALALRLRHSWFGVVGHPLGVALLLGIQWYAMFRRRSQRPVRWKGRELPSG